MNEGTLVRGRVLARLFGVKLLTLEAQVVVTPAEVEAEAEHRPAALPPRHRPAALPPRRGPTGEPRPIGTGLAEATRTLDEGAASLAAARNGINGA